MPVNWRTCFDVQSPWNVNSVFVWMYVYLSSTLPEIDPDTADVVCISVWFGFPYMVSICPCFSYMVSISPCFHIYGNTTHWSGYGVAMGCYGLFIVPRTAIVTSQWYDRYCFMEYARMWARQATTHQLTTRMHGDYRLSIDRFFVGFNAICYTFLWNNPIYIEGRNCRLSTVPRLFNK